jgi:hypothetical protein
MSLWRVDTVGGPGEFIQPISFPPGVINKDSLVFISATEIQQPPNQTENFPFVGAAVMTVHNIVPFNNGTVDVVFDTGDNASAIGLRFNIAVDP